MSEKSVELTKKQEFDWEMKYKPIFETCYKYYSPAKWAIKDKVKDISENRMSIFDTDDDRFEFLKTYSNIVNWLGVLGSNIQLFTKYSEKFEEFSDNFNDDCWNLLSTLHNIKTNKDFIKKHKDKLNWSNLSEGIGYWDLEFLYEMRDYINPEKITNGSKIFNISYGNRQTKESKNLDWLELVCRNYIKRHFKEIIEEQVAIFEKLNTTMIEFSSEGYKDDK